jgi:hypothetical protein
MRFLFLIFLITACGRPLSESEANFAAQFHGKNLDTTQIRITRSPVIPLYKSTYPVPPRRTCAQKLFPPSTEKFVTAPPAATVLFNTIHINPDIYSRDYLKRYPDLANILAAMFLAHEFVHVWQWQNRETTGYHPLKAAAEHQASPDPYLFDLATHAKFQDFGYEQQGAIAGEFICCAALAPKAPRTQRLKNLLSQVFPIQNLTTTLPKTTFPLPWDQTDLADLCA